MAESPNSVTLTAKSTKRKISGNKARGHESGLV
ncbi:MAG: hypothetical protein ACI89D_001779, partial [Bermanella sp.]